MAQDIKQLTGRAGEIVFGFKANSRSLRPIHFTHPLFNHILDYAYVYDDDLLDLWDKPSKKPSSELSTNIKSLFDGSRPPNNERIDRIRRYMRLILNNDEVLYNSPIHNAPTCTSDWLVTKVTDAVSIGRFLYFLIDHSDDSLERKIDSQLRDHHDGISLLVRPLIQSAAERGPGVNVDEWEGPEIGNDSILSEDGIAQNLLNGFNRLNTHLREPHGASSSYPHDLERVIRFGSFALYLFMINRNYEIRENTHHNYRIPLLFHFTTESDSIENASVQNVNIAQSEVENATRFGVRLVLDNWGWKSFDEAEIITRLEEQSLIDLNRNNEEKVAAEFETLRSMYEVEPAENTFDKLVNVFSNAIHDSTFNSYPPRNTVQSFGWRIGLLQPRGNRANRRRFQPSAELLESIVLSTIEPGPEHQMTLPEFCERLREQYGIIVGGDMEQDRAHLNDWGIRIGSDVSASDPLGSLNYRAFENTLVDLDYATKYADGVTLVEVVS